MNSKTNYVETLGFYLKSVKVLVSIYWIAIICMVFVTETNTNSLSGAYSGALVSLLLAVALGSTWGADRLGDWMKSTGNESHYRDDLRGGFVLSLLACSVVAGCVVAMALSIKPDNQALLWVLVAWIAVYQLLNVTKLLTVEFDETNPVDNSED